MTKTKNILIKAGAILLALALIAVYTVDFGQVSAEEKNPQKDITEEFPELLAHESGGENMKTETVYGMLDQSGNVKDVTVSEWLQDSSDTINDFSLLKNIENTSGDEKFTQKGNNITWESGGSDITYSGEYTGELPVSVKVSYFLDGKQVSPSGIAGKKGNVKIRFDYEVNDTVSADGYQLTRPYAIVSAVVLDGEHFTDVEVDNGKAVSDGERDVAVGIALPGLKDNLGITSVDIPESVEISAYTDSFQIDGTYTVAKAGFLDSGNISGLDNAANLADELEDGLNQLSDASEKLVEGTKTLADGTSELAKNTGKIKDGAKDLKSGADDLSSGTAKLQEEGTAGLRNGTKDLNDKAKELAAGAALVDGKAKELATGAKELDGGANQLNEGVKSVASEMEELTEDVLRVKEGFDTYYAGLKNFTSGSDATEVLIGVLNNSKILAENADDQDLANAIAALLDEDNGYFAKYDAAYSKGQAIQTGLNSIYGSLTDEEKSKSLKQLVDGAGTLAAGLDNLSTGADALQKEGTAGVSEGSSKLQKEGTEAAYQGAKELDENAKKLAGGAKSLDEGTGTIAGAISKLSAGTDKLNEGAGTLAESMNKFDKEGIKKFVSELDDVDLKEKVARIKAVAHAASMKTMIAGKADSMEGDSKIIFKTGEVK